jgi:hypothetical protein
MIYMLSWAGRGWVAFLAIWFAVFAGLGLGALIGRAEVLCFGLGWLASGVVCFVLGKKWNGRDKIHKFCGLALQTWGWIYGGIGLFLSWAGFQAARMGM